MLRFEGDREFSQATDELWAKLTDAHFLVQCIPDIDTVRDVQADRASLVIRPGFSFVRGTLDLNLKVIEAVLPNARMVLHSKGIGSSSDVEAMLTLVGQEPGPGTRVHWVVEIKTLGGLLKMVPPGLIRGAAQKVVDDAWNAVSVRLRDESEKRPEGGPEGV